MRYVIHVLKIKQRQHKLTFTEEPYTKFPLRNYDESTKFQLCHNDGFTTVPLPLPSTLVLTISMGSKCLDLSATHAHAHTKSGSLHLV